MYSILLFSEMSIAIEIGLNNEKCIHEPMRKWWRIGPNATKGLVQWSIYVMYEFVTFKISGSNLDITLVGRLNGYFGVTRNVENESCWN